MEPVRSNPKLKDKTVTLILGDFSDISGDISINRDVYGVLMKSIYNNVTKKYKTDSSRTYTYRDYELSITCSKVGSGKFDNKQCVHKKELYSKLCKSYAVIVEEVKCVKPEAVPILNSYHDIAECSTRYYIDNTTSTDIMISFVEEKEKDDNVINWVKITFVNSNKDVVNRAEEILHLIIETVSPN